MLTLLTGDALQAEHAYRRERLARTWALANGPRRRTAAQQSRHGRTLGRDRAVATAR